MSDIDAPATITAIDPLQRDPSSRRIRVGRRTVGVLTAARVDELRLRVGQRWSERLAKRVAHAVAADAARAEAMRILGRTACASGSLRARLTRRGHEESVADRVIADLIESGWLDDRAFGTAVAQSVLRRGPLGRDALAARLVRRGLDRTLAASIATAATRRGAVDANGEARTDDVAEALEWANASLRRAGTLTRVRAQRRIAAGLARRGLDADTIDAVLERLDLAADR